MTCTHPMTALFIDDEKFDHIVYRRIANRSGIVEKIHSFYYPDDALAFLKSADRDKIDFILLDINMPRMSGFEFLDAALSEPDDPLSDAVVVMLTTSLNPNDFRRAEEYAVVKESFTKPLTLEHLERIARIANRHEAC